MPHRSAGTPLTIVTDATQRAHDPAYELNAGRRVSPRHERPARLDAIVHALDAAGYPRRGPTRTDTATITAVHDRDMLAFLRHGYDAWRAAGGPEVMLADTFRSPRWAGGGRPTRSPLGAAGWWCFDTATPIAMGSYEAARAAVDVAVTAADLVTAGAPMAFGVTRPPGHHAGPDYLGGFCLLNHAAVAARRLASLGRVAVLDVDVHHGNGTQDVFWRDPDVLYVSVHADPDHLFPYFSGFTDEIGAGPGRGATRNLPVAPGTGDAAYLATFAEATDAIEDFGPAVLLVSLGLDAALDDPVGCLSLSPAGFHAIGRAIGELQLPTVLLQEGGYAVEQLGELTLRVLDGLGHPAPGPTPPPT